MSVAGSSSQRRSADYWPLFKRIMFAVAGLAIGALFLWLALRDINRREIEAAIAQVQYRWLVVAVVMYLASIAARACAGAFCCARPAG